MSEWKYNNKYYDNDPEDVAATILDNAEVDVPNRNIKWRSLFDADEVINEPDDLPELNASNEVPLSDNTSYLVTEPINLDVIGAEGIRLGSNSPIHSPVPGKGVLFKTSAGALLRGSNEPFISVFMTYAAPGGSIFDLDAGNDTDFLTFLCSVSNLGGALPSSGNLGGVEGFRVQNLKAFAFEDYDASLTLTGSPRKTLVDGCVFRTPSAGADALEFDASYSAGDIDITGSYFKAFPGSENILVWNGSVSNRAVFRGNLGDAVEESRLSGVSVGTPGWDFNANAGIPDSDVRLYYDLTGNTTATTISSQNQWEVIAGTPTEELTERMESPSDFVYRYTGLRRIEKEVKFSFTATADGPDTFEFGIFQNGSLVTFLPVNFGNTSANQAGRTKLAVLDLSPATSAGAGDGDEFSLRVRNTTGTNDMTVEAADIVAQ